MWSDADRSTSCVRFSPGYFHMIPVLEEVALEQDFLGIFFGFVLITITPQLIHTHVPLWFSLKKRITVYKWKVDHTPLVQVFTEDC
jgi:hypothetical protein